MREARGFGPLVPGVCQEIAGDVQSCLLFLALCLMYAAMGSAPWHRVVLRWGWGGYDLCG